MDDFYADMRDMADEVMADFKQGVVTMTRVVPGEPNPATPWTPGPPVETSYPLSAVVRGVSAKYIDGTTVVASDLQITCAVPEVKPDMHDRIVIDGREHSIKRILPIPAAGEPVAYTIILAA